LWKSFLAAGILSVLFVGAIGCGGGGDGTTPATVPTATIQGSVSGTVIMAVDETGKIQDTDDTAGKTPVPGTVPPEYPFSLTVPVGHQYTFQFLVDQGLPTERILPLDQGGQNIFSISSTKLMDLGFVNTSAPDKAVPDNNVLTPVGTTPSPTIKLQGYRYLYTRNDPDGAISARFHAEVRDPSGTTPVTDRSLVRGVAFFDNAWNELPLSGVFVLWNGTGMFINDASGNIVPGPLSDVEGTLVKAPSQLAEGFYNVVVTDNAGNLHKAQVYFRQPDAVDKPLLVNQTINADNSITLNWTNPSFPVGPNYDVRLAVRTNDQDGDTIDDWHLQIIDRVPPLRESYTIPASFVASNLVGKTGLKWEVQIRQYDNTIVFPDGTSQGNNTQFYRNISAQSPLRLPGEPLKFTTEMLAGKIFYSDFVEQAGFVANLLFFNTDGSLRIDLTDDVGTDTLMGSWSINSAGQAIANIQGAISTVTLLSDSSTEMTVSVVEGTLPPQEQVLQKTIPIVASKLLGTYDVDYGDVMTFNSGGKGTSEFFGNFNWDVAGGKLIINWVDAGGSSTESYALASTKSTDTAYISLQMGAKDIEGGAVILVYPWTLTPQPQ
jgi:hypothetical protein